MSEGRPGGLRGGCGRGGDGVMQGERLKQQQQQGVAAPLLCPHCPGHSHSNAVSWTQQCYIYIYIYIYIHSFFKNFKFPLPLFFVWSSDNFPINNHNQLKSELR